MEGEERRQKDIFWKQLNFKANLPQNNVRNLSGKIQVLLY